MKFCNRLKSLTWNSFVESSRNRRLRRRRPNWAPITLAAEMLEVRALLSGPAANVTAVVSGTALTLTGDKLGDHSVSVYRVDATHIEIDSTSAMRLVNIRQQNSGRCRDSTTFPQFRRKPTALGRG